MLMLFIRILTILLFACSLQAQIVEHHDHKGLTNFKLGFQSLEFKNSKKKDEGKRYGIELDHQSGRHHYQVYIEKTLTDTTKVMPKDLEVEKITLKYQHNLSKKEKLSFSFVTDILFTNTSQTPQSSQLVQKN